MILVQEEKILDRHKIDKVMDFMRQMVSHYMRLNVGCRKLFFYVPDYFAEQLIFYYQDYSPVGLRMNSSGLTIWGVEVHSGYENKVILFCPSHTPSAYSPVMELSRFSQADMYISEREK